MFHNDYQKLWCFRGLCWSLDFTLRTTNLFFHNFISSIPENCAFMCTENLKFFSEHQWFWAPPRYTSNTSADAAAYPAAPRCPSGCRRRGCWRAAAAARVRSAWPELRRGASCTEGGRRRRRPDLGSPPPPARRAGTPGSQRLPTSTRQPCKGASGGFQDAAVWNCGSSQRKFERGQLKSWPRAGV